MTEGASTSPLAPSAVTSSSPDVATRKRILHISTRLILGGSQENTVLSCEGQVRRGREVFLAFGPIHGPEGSLLDRVERFEHEGQRIRTQIVPHLVREISPWADWRAYQELKDLIARLRPDVVHTHSSKAGILGRAAAHAVRAKGGVNPVIVHTIHGPPFMPVDGPWPQRVKTRMFNAVYTIAERFAAKRCDVIVGVADAMTRAFLARRIGQPAQYTTVYSGMEVDAFLEPREGETRDDMRAALGLSNDDLVIGTVARLAEHKGHDDLLDALEDDLRSRRGWRLLWVGDGWWRDRLIARATSLGLVVAQLDRHDANATGVRDAHIILTGLVPPERVAGLIRAMDILAHPSYREGLPRTVPQALLCGVVPVAYDVDGAGEVCRHERTGLLVPLGDRARLREAIVRLANSPELRQRLATQGCEQCRNQFSVYAMIEALEDLYARGR